MLAAIGFILFAPAVAAIVGVCAAVYRLSARRRHVMSGVTCCVVVSGLVACGGLAVVLVWSQRPSQVFSDEFGFAPPAGTSILRVSSSSWGDSGSVALSFKASPATVNQIVEAEGLTWNGPTVSHNGRPDWFAIPVGLHVQRYSSTSGWGTSTRPSHGGFCSEYRSLTYDPDTGTVAYEFIGVD